MYKKVILLTLFVVPAMAFSQTRLDISERGQFLREGGGGIKALAAEDVEKTLTLGTTSGPNGTIGSLRLGMARGPWFYQGSIMAGHGSTGSFGSGGQLYVDYIPAAMLKDVTVLFQASYDHVRPSENAATFGVTLCTQPTEGQPFVFSATGTWMKGWDSGFQDDGIIGDIGASFEREGGMRFETGYVAPSRIAGDADWFFRVGKMLSKDTRVRLRYNRDDVWTVDFVVRF